MTSPLLDNLEKEIAATEAVTSTEVVVVLARRAEAYRDVPWKTGSLLAGAALLAIVWLPVEFSADWMILDLSLAFGLGWLAGRSSDPLRCLLTSRRRRREAAVARAHQTFSERGVSLTRSRTGLLWFFSLMEQESVLLWDAGFERCVPYSRLALAAREIEHAMRGPDLLGGFRKGFEILRPILAQHLPAGSENPNEIPNRPVVLP